MVKKLILAGLLSACSPVSTGGLPPLVDPSRHVEKEKLAVPPEEERVPVEIPRGLWVEALEANDPSHPAGILVSEEKAWLLALYQIKYKELREKTEANNDVISAQRGLYEHTVASLRTQVRDLQPSWYDRNKGVLWGVVGSAITAGVILSVDR